MSQVAEELKWIEDEEEFKYLAEYNEMEREEGMEFAGAGWYTILADTKTREIAAWVPLSEADRAFAQFVEDDRNDATS